MFPPYPWCPVRCFRWQCRSKQLKAPAQPEILHSGYPDDGESFVSLNWPLPLVVPLHKHQTLALVGQGIGDIQGRNVPDKMSQWWHLWW
jgi:hypothetical protein